MVGKKSHRLFSKNQQLCINIVCMRNSRYGAPFPRALEQTAKSHLYGPLSRKFRFKMCKIPDKITARVKLIISQVNQSINQTNTQSINQTLNQSINLSIYLSINQSNTQTLNQSINQSTHTVQSSPTTAIRIGPSDALVHQIPKAFFGRI